MSLDCSATSVGRPAGQLERDRPRVVRSRLRPNRRLGAVPAVLRPIRPIHHRPVQAQPHPIFARGGGRRRLVFRLRARFGAIVRHDWVLVGRFVPSFELTPRKSSQVPQPLSSNRPTPAVSLKAMDDREQNPPHPMALFRESVRNFWKVYLAEPPNPECSFGCSIHAPLLRTQQCPAHPRNSPPTAQMHKNLAVPRPPKAKPSPELTPSSTG